MSVHYSNLLFLTLCSIGLLLGALLLDRWWRERIYDLKDKAILITGGSRGLGLVMARQLIEAGARLAICARDEIVLELARIELEQQGGQVLALPCDVTDRSQVEQMVQQVRDRFGAIDILINNAGMDIVGPMGEMTMQDYDDTMKLHFWAPLYTTYAVLPQMLQRQAGRIVNISSIGGKVIFPHMLPYCASKFALTGLSEGMRTELAKEGIAVTTVCPGFIRTGVLDRVIFKGQHRKEYAWFSIGDSLPLSSSSAERVARSTIAALKRGDAEAILSLPAQIATRFHGLFPGLNSNLLGWINRFLPAAGGIGSDRALGKDSRSFWWPAWLTFLSDRAARRNNEIADVQLADGDRANEDATVQSDLSCNQPEQMAQVSPEVKACLNDIQNTMGISWTPANWQAYAIYPAVMQLFWQRLKPAVQTEPFLRNAIAIADRVHRDIDTWYQPTYQLEIDEAQRHRIGRELNAFTFGNPQLLIQQVALNRTLQGHVVGRDGSADLRHALSPYRHLKIPMLDEQAVQEVSEEMQRVYQDIKQTLGSSIIFCEYQALAPYPAFFLAAWEDLKQWRSRPEYELLRQDVVQQANAAADRLCPAVAIGEREVRDLLENPDDFDTLVQTLQVFTDLLAELIVNDALFYMGLAHRQPIAKL